MKYKVGDRATVVNKKTGGMNEDMCRFLEKKVTISSIHYGSYSIEEDDGEWYWVDYMFEGLSPEKTCKNCKYKDLKDTSFPCCNCSENYFNQFEVKSTSKLEELKKILRKKIDVSLYTGKQEYKVTTLRDVVSIIEELESEDD